MIQRALLMTALGVALGLGGVSTASAQPPRSPKYNYPIDYNAPMEVFIEGLYRNVMGRDAYPQEIDHWLQRMDILKSRARMADEFIQNFNAVQAENEATADPDYRTPVPRYTPYRRPYVPPGRYYPPPDRWR